MSTFSPADRTAAGSPLSFAGHPLRVTRGHPLPLGADINPSGVNFALICQHATAIRLVLSEPHDPGTLTEIVLDPRRHRTGDHWHIRVDGLPGEFCYGYRVDGPRGNGHRYDPSIVLLDPASRALSCSRAWGTEGVVPRRSLVNTAMNPDQDDVNPCTPREDTVIYELHVRGYTIDPSSGVRHRGTFAGLIEKIPYLKALGVTAVELLPIDEFDENDCPFVNPLTGERLRNFWGYDTVAYTSPKAAYASNPEEHSAPWVEFRRMVKAFHDAGLEVILDVVFNHTAERGEGGPTYSFRGLDNSLYYMLDEQGRYLDFTGCGNTVSSNNPVVRGFILSCLRSYVDEADVDGFRFDLASVLGRDRCGDVLLEPPVIEMISQDALLAHTKLIAEPWDAAGLYQVGTFPGGPRWSGWNGRYRDDVRRFWRGDPGMTSALATRLCGSDDLYHGRGPLHSINFITCHDGFTLADLVSYNEKHNEVNGEGNRDGTNANWSWNCGVEGPTADPQILALRRRQARNLIATLLLSQGVPMILGGDEFLRTQRGNNNAWCQDDTIGWMDWTLAEEHAYFLRFVRQMISLRMRHPALRRRTFFRGGDGHLRPEIMWHGVEPCRPDFSWHSRSLALTLDGCSIDRPDVIDRDLYIAMNAWEEPLMFQIPAAPSGRLWRRAADTSLPAPRDILGLDEGPVIPVAQPYRVADRSLIVLVSEADRARHDPDPTDPSGGDAPYGCPIHSSSPGNAAG
jgi:isoamylase